VSGPGAGGRQAAQVAAGIFLTRVLGYVRELLFAHYLGNDWAADAFRVALRIPNTIRNLLGEGTLAGSFIPVYATFNERPDKTEARALAGAVLGLLLLAASALALVGIAAAPALVTVFGAGLQGQSRALAVALMRILFPMSGLMVISAWCLGVLNTHRRFFLSYAAQSLWNVAGIAALVAGATWLVAPTLPLVDRLTRLSYSLAWGTVAGAVLQVAVQLPACRRALGGLAVRFSWRTSGVRDVVVAWLPLLIGAGVAQISGLIDTLLGTLAGEGGASSLGYAQLLQVLPISLFGASVAQASLPELSRDAIATGGGANEQLRSRIAVGFRRIAFFVLPSAFLFAALGPVLVAALFQTGRFAHSDSVLVGGVIAAYGVSGRQRSNCLRPAFTPCAIPGRRSRSPPSRSPWGAGSAGCCCGGSGRRGSPWARRWAERSAPCCTCVISTGGSAPCCARSIGGRWWWRCWGRERLPWPASARQPRRRGSASCLGPWRPWVSLEWFTPRSPPCCGTPTPFAHGDP